MGRHVMEMSGIKRIICCENGERYVEQQKRDDPGECLKEGWVMAFYGLGDPDWLNVNYCPFCGKKCEENYLSIIS
jgi:hypothetical protein